MPNEDAENEGLDRQDLPESSEPPKGESGDRSELAGHSDQSDELIVPTGDISQREAAASSGTRPANSMIFWLTGGVNQKNLPGG